MSRNISFLSIQKTSAIAHSVFDKIVYKICQQSIYTLSLFKKDDCHGFRAYERTRSN